MNTFSPTREMSDVRRTGFDFIQALANAAMEACERRQPWDVFYYMKRTREVEGMLRTIERMEQNQ